MATGIGPGDFNDDVFSCIAKYDDHESIIRIHQEMLPPRDDEFSFHNINTDTIK